jgi:hypothetical protein
MLNTLLLLAVVEVLAAQEHLLTEVAVVALADFLWELPQ